MDGLVRKVPFPKRLVPAAHIYLSRRHQKYGLRGRSGSVVTTCRVHKKDLKCNKALETSSQSGIKMHCHKMKNIKSFKSKFFFALSHKKPQREREKVGEEG